MAENDKIKFSVIIHMEGANPDYFRAFLESLTQNIYTNYELVITDSGSSDLLGTIASEFFPEKGKLIYRRVKPGRSRGYALNYAISLAKGEYFLFFDRHSKLSPIALKEMAKAATLRDADIIYSDNDEISGNDRTNPDYKPDANTELIRHRNYIGDIFAVSRDALKTIGAFHDTLNYAAIYDFLLRAFEKKCKIVHIPKLLYSKRIIILVDDRKVNYVRLESAYKEHLAAVNAHIKRLGLLAEAHGTKRSSHWNVEYKGEDYRAHRGEYIVLRDKGVRVRLRDAIPKLYGILRQPDVGVVGCAFTYSPFAYDNCGYIYSKEGDIYPACHGQSILYDGYNLRCILPRDVSSVDVGFCLIKKKVFKGLNGFDKSLDRQSVMLDFCLRAKRAGYRTVYTPKIKAKRKLTLHDPDIVGREILIGKWGETITKGDPLYNINLPMGLDNYF